MTLKMEHIVFGAVTVGLLLAPQLGFAHEGETFKEEISSLEKLVTGGYLRLGLMTAGAGTAIFGILKQNPHAMLIGAGGAVFVHFLHKWIQTTFTVVI